MATNEKMTLSDWILSLGMNQSEMAEKAGVTALFVKESCRGVKGTPMHRASIQKILDVLSKEHGRPVTLADIQDLKVLGG